MDVYMDDLLYSAQGDPTQQQKVSKLTIHALKDIFPSFLEEVEDSASLKKALARNGYWAMVKDILGWMIYNHRVTPSLSYKQRLGLLSLLAIPTTQRRISVKIMEHLIGKLRSMPLVLLGSIDHFYAMQVTLTHA